MDRSSSNSDILTSSGQKSLSHQSQSLRRVNLQQASQNTQENDITKQRDNTTEIKGVKTDRRYKVKENENSENYNAQNTPSAQNIGKAKEKTMLIEGAQSVKKDGQIKNNAVLTERPVNIALENKSLSSRRPDDIKRKQKISIEDQSQKSFDKSLDESSFVTTPKRDPLAIAMNLKKLQKYSVKQLLHVSKSKICFGKNMPGQIVEEPLDIVNKTNQNLVVQIELDSENHEFRDTEEYVYSIRRSHLYDFNDKHYLIMAPFSSASFKVTLKVPGVKRDCNNNGFANISIKGLKEHIKVALESKIKVPKVTCPKSLFNQNAKLDIIKLAAKEGKKQDYKLPFKNEGDTPVTLEFSFHNPGEAYKGETAECSIYPQTVTIQPNSSSMLNFSAKVGQIRLRDKRTSHHKEKGVCAKKVLLGKVKDTNLIYSYYFCIETY